MKIKIILFALFSSSFMLAQNQEDCRFEQIAFNYFVENLALKNYTNCKFSFSENIENSNGFSTCMPAKMIEKQSCQSVIIKNDLIKFKKQFTFFDRLFLNKNKRKRITIFQHYTYENEIVVCILVSDYIKDDFYTFKIEKGKKSVVDYCLTKMVS